MNITLIPAEYVCFVSAKLNSPENKEFTLYFLGLGVEDPDSSWDSDDSIRSSATCLTALTRGCGRVGSGMYDNIDTGWTFLPRSYRKQPQFYLVLRWGIRLFSVFVFIYLSSRWFYRKPRILDSTSKNFPDFWFPIPNSLTWGEREKWTEAKLCKNNALSWRLIWINYLFTGAFNLTMYLQFVLLSLKVFHQSESKKQRNRNINIIDLKLPKALEACTL